MAQARSVGEPVRDRAGRLHLNGLGLEADEPAQVVLVPPRRPPLVGDAHLERPVLPKQIVGNASGMAMLWAA